MGRAALSVGVVGSHAVAHLAVAGHLRATHAAAHKRVEVALVILVGRPEVGLVHQNVEVEGEAVAFSHEAVGVVHVVLYTRVVGGIGSQGIGVDVVERGGAQHVVHGHVVHVLVRRHVDAHVERGKAAHFHAQGRCQRHGEVVLVVALDVVDGVLSGHACLMVGKV